MRTAVILALGCLTLLSSPAFALRCGSDLVGEGDIAALVLQRCGEPVHRQSWQKELREGVGSSRETRRSVEVEEWTYNFGPSDFVYLLTFENGTLAAIRSTGRGYAKEEGNDRCRHGQLLNEGDLTGEVLLKCGEPARRESWEEKRVEAVGPGREERTVIRVDQWTYNFGPHNFIHRLRFQNGRLVKIEQQGYGY